MGCSNCNSCERSETRGCGTSSVFDWLYQIENPKEEDKLLTEVQFKGERKEFYINTNQISIRKGDWVAVEGEKSGHDLGKVTSTGDIVALQMKRKNKIKEKTKLKKIYRLATDLDMQKWRKATKKEHEILKKSRKIVDEFKLNMKISDVEFQGDSTKATFYYTAEKRIDFRELIKEYSKQFSTRIEMRQIGIRQESAKLGGIGSCGRELCCSTWMVDFPVVSTSAARYQQLAINPQKISGQCGRLKCCLNFELESYTEGLKDFPDTKIRLKFKKGDAKFVKLDVFKKTMFYSYLDSPSDMWSLKVQSVKEVINLNKKRFIPKQIEDYIVKEIKQEAHFENASGKDNISRFQRKRKQKKK